MRVPLKEVQSTRTQRPTSGSSYPYVEIMIGDLVNQRITQLQLEQVCEHVARGTGRDTDVNGICFCVLCICLCFPGPGVMPRCCHAHGEHVVCQRKETHPATK